jgi:hypothetical protein
LRNKETEERRTSGKERRWSPRRRGHQPRWGGWQPRKSLSRLIEERNGKQTNCHLYGTNWCRYKEPKSLWSLTWPNLISKRFRGRQWWWCHLRDTSKHWWRCSMHWWSSILWWCSMQPWNFILCWWCTLLLVIHFATRSMFEWWTFSEDL